jgi:cold-inducible RNA-binding protein
MEWIDYLCVKFFKKYTNMKLFVAGLPYDVDDQELQEMFETYGTVGSARVILDRETRKSRGFGFVEFANDDEAKEAIKALDGGSLEGRQLTVKLAEDKPGGGGGSGRGGGGGGYRDNRGGGGGGYNRR